MTMSQAMRRAYARGGEETNRTSVLQSQQQRRPLAALAAGALAQAVKREGGGDLVGLVRQEAGGDQRAWRIGERAGVVQQQRAQQVGEHGGRGWDRVAAQIAAGDVERDAVDGGVVARGVDRERV